MENEIIRVRTIDGSRGCEFTQAASEIKLHPHQVKRVLQAPSEAMFPRDAREAIERTLPLVAAIDSAKLTQVEPMIFKRGWYSIWYLNDQVDPDNVLDATGSLIRANDNAHPLVRLYDTRIAMPVYAATGWPVLLAEVACNAVKRVEYGSMTTTERLSNFRIAQGAGMERRSEELQVDVRGPKI